MDTKYTTVEVDVLKKHTLMDAAGNLTQVDLVKPDDKPLGPGPKMDAACIRRLLDTDTTPNKAWLDWIFFQSGGGKRGKESSDRALEQIKLGVIEDCQKGVYISPIDDSKVPKMTQAQAEAYWPTLIAGFTEHIHWADQDICDRLGVFGYHRSWPGRAKIYEKTCAAVTDFIALTESRAKVNQELTLSGQALIPEDPAGYGEIYDLEQANMKVKRYISSKEARDDVRAEKIVDDDFVRVVAPLTYAASVRYGYDEWPISNKAAFEEMLLENRSYRDHWKLAVGQNSVCVFITLHHPMPSWVVRKNNKFTVATLGNLALSITAEQLRDIKAGKRGVIEKVEVTDEGGQKVKLSDVRGMVMREVNRVDTADEAAMPVNRGANVYASEAEAKEVIVTLDRAVSCIEHWAKTFDVKSVKAVTIPEASE